LGGGFLRNQQSDPWSHRRKSAGYVSGTLRYEVLKRAMFRCELCGASAEDRALEVDHIVPRNTGGSDDLSNLQALCYSCNAMKRDRDTTDFRAMASLYRERADGCIFCNIDATRIVSENELIVAIRDAYPVTEGHSLLIPRRHVVGPSDLFQPELNAMWAISERMMGWPPVRPSCMRISISSRGDRVTPKTLVVECAE